jgi:membrane fusion protein (multidrug efflux system)
LLDQTRFELLRLRDFDMSLLQMDKTQLLESSAATLPLTPSAPRLAKSGIKLRRVAAWVGAILVVGFFAGLLPRLHQREALRAETRDLAIPSVMVVSPAPGLPGDAVALPAEVKPYIEAPIYARSSGYLKSWLVDIGAKVEAGELLAEIDAPELLQELAQARAQLAQAQANLALAKITAARWSDLLKTASVSEQEAAEKQADLALKSATVDAFEANVRRLLQLKSFSSVTAPFAGTITARRIDIGDLIVAGSVKELFRLAQTRTLRVFVRVPQALARAVRVGQTTELTVPEIPARVFPAKVVRTAGAMDSQSRTLYTELEVDNAKDEILSGSFAQVRFVETKLATALSLPSNTLLFRAEGLQVGVVNAQGKVELRSVSLGRDYGAQVEVLGGVTPADRVIVNPADSLVSGTTVRVVDAAGAPSPK